MRLLEAAGRTHSQWDDHSQRRKLETGPRLIRTPQSQEEQAKREGGGSKGSSSGGLVLILLRLKIKTFVCLLKSRVESQ